MFKVEKTLLTVSNEGAGDDEKVSIPLKAIMYRLSKLKKLFSSEINVVVKSILIAKAGPELGKAFSSFVRISNWRPGRSRINVGLIFV
jgi:hypothetical protein